RKPARGRGTAVRRRQRQPVRPAPDAGLVRPAARPARAGPRVDLRRLDRGEGETPPGPAAGLPLAAPAPPSLAGTAAPRPPPPPRPGPRRSFPSPLFHPEMRPAAPGGPHKSRTRRTPETPCFSGQIALTSCPVTIFGPTDRGACMDWSATQTWLAGTRSARQL